LLLLENAPLGRFSQGRIKMTRTLIVAAMLALSLTACKKTGDTPPASGATSSTTPAPAGLSQLGGHQPGTK
jgi:hypothetical protein